MAAIQGMRRPPRTRFRTRPPAPLGLPTEGLRCGIPQLESGSGNRWRSRVPIPIAATSSLAPCFGLMGWPWGRDVPAVGSKSTKRDGRGWMFERFAARMHSLPGRLGVPQRPVPTSSHVPGAASRCRSRQTRPAAGSRQPTDGRNCRQSCRDPTEARGRCNPGVPNRLKARGRIASALLRRFAARPCPGSTIPAELSRPGHGRCRIAWSDCWRTQCSDPRPRQSTS